MAGVLRRSTFATRRLHAPETVLFGEHLKRLDAETRRLRFGNPVNDAFLDRYAGLALGEDALVKGCFIAGTLRGVAELRFLSGDGRDAEGAFSLEREYQGQKIGDALFERLIAAARNRGVERLYLTCLRENRRMQSIAHRHGAELSFTGGDGMAEIRRPYADAESLAREWMDEGATFVFAMLEWRRQRFDFLTRPIRRLSEGRSL
ncbi:MAG: GNAT family N-acetyltransferase [Rhizobiaceae bacterium]|nr:GNAT family N-acetyltransferase [Rhizobiaceae bacterium]